jgi:hypothetical protein
MKANEAISTRAEKLPIISHSAQEAERIIEKMPDGVRQAMEAMQRTLRARRSMNETEPNLRYHRIS